MTVAPKMQQTSTGTFLLPFLWSMICVYAFSRVLQVYPGRFPMLDIVALHVFPPALFALAHGAVLYGKRGIAMFVCLCLAIGNVIENIGVTTGFPFGTYYFTDVMGPKLFQVNVMLGLAYVGMLYLSWTLAEIILNRSHVRLAGHRVLTMPLLAALIMTCWDLSMDPIWSTVKHAWIWVHGGAYFGVPLSNFVGWYLDVYLICQSFALYLWKFSGSRNAPCRKYSRVAVIFYAVSAGGNLLLLLPSKEFPILTDPAGLRWKLGAITAACALVTVFTMGVFSCMAWMELNRFSRKMKMEGITAEPQTAATLESQGSTTS